MEVGRQVIDGPGLVLCFRCHSRDLAGDIGKGCQLRDVGAPRFHPALANRWLAEMVEDEAHLRALRNEFAGGRQ